MDQSYATYGTYDRYMLSFKKSIKPDVNKRQLHSFLFHLIRVTIISNFQFDINTNRPPILWSWIFFVPGKLYSTFNKNELNYCY